MLTIISLKVFALQKKSIFIDYSRYLIFWFFDLYLFSLMTSLLLWLKNSDSMISIKESVDVYLWTRPRSIHILLNLRWESMKTVTFIINDVFIVTILKYFQKEISLSNTICHHIKSHLRPSIDIDEISVTIFLVSASEDRSKFDYSSFDEFDRAIKRWDGLFKYTFEKSRDQDDARSFSILFESHWFFSPTYTTTTSCIVDIDTRKIT